MELKVEFEKTQRNEVKLENVNLSPAKGKNKSNTNDQYSQTEIADIAKIITCTSPVKAKLNMKKMNPVWSFIKKVIHKITPRKNKLNKQ